MHNEEKFINAIRYLGLKSIQAAGNGHIGMTISAAPITYTLYTKFIRINPKNGKWINRDRFVLSGGHGSMSVYPILHMAGLMDLNELKNFKLEDSQTPGHPEYEPKVDNFIDASTGPLGQGFAMGVGMAIAQRHLANLTQNDFPDFFDHYTYVLVGDGDLQEGISYEAQAIAGRHKLDKLIVLHDSNKFQLDSAVSEVSNEDLRKRFESTNWYYQKCSNNPNDIELAIRNAQESGLPSFIEVDTVIAESLDVQNSNKGHHGVIDSESLAKFNSYFGTNFFGWELDPEIYFNFREKVASRGARAYDDWLKLAATYKNSNLDGFKRVEKWLRNDEDYKEHFDLSLISKSSVATRNYLKDFIANLDTKVPNVISLAADIIASCNLKISNDSFTTGGNAFYAGIREFAMAAISNGINLHGALKVISGTFLVFADYMKSAIRLGALMGVPNIFVFTHDSYQVGGDGPTHQPYDQLPMLRAIDNVQVHRPCDELELQQALIEAFSSKRKTNIIILTRQPIPSLTRTRSSEKINKGIYALNQIINPDYVIAASGSELSLAIEIAERLQSTRVVSVPCLDKINKLSEKEKNDLFSARKVLLTLEASSDYKWLLLNRNNQKNLHVGAFSFGKSMDGELLYRKKGFDVDKIVEHLKSNS